jgi:outer membrane protein assembly factor BamB
VLLVYNIKADMDSKYIIKIFTFSLGIISLGFLAWWLGTDPTHEFEISMEGADNRGSGGVAQEVAIGEHFEQFATDYVNLPEHGPASGAAISITSPNRTYHL